MKLPYECCPNCLRQFLQCGNCAHRTDDLTLAGTFCPECKTETLAMRQTIKCCQSHRHVPGGPDCPHCGWKGDLLSSVDRFRPIGVA